MDYSSYFISILHANLLMMFILILYWSLHEIFTWMMNLIVCDIHSYRQKFVIFYGYYLRLDNSYWENHGIYMGQSKVYM